MQSIIGLGGSNSMTANHCIRGTVTAYSLSIILGLFVAWFDVRAPFGDDTSKGTVLLWLVFGGSLGFLWPRQSWRWAASLGPWVPAIHLLRHVWGLPDSINPNNYATILLLVPVSLAVCLIGSFGGSLLRNQFRQA
jgi:hypothetical protein